MKVFCFIFIVYLFALLSVPCEEFFSAVPNDPVQTARFDRTTDAEHQSDGCTPFCICSCCGQSVANPILFFSSTSEIEVAAIRNPRPEYSTPETATYNNIVWQPPKV